MELDAANSQSSSGAGCLGRALRVLGIFFLLLFLASMMMLPFIPFRSGDLTEIYLILFALLCVAAIFFVFSSQLNKQNGEVRKPKSTLSMAMQTLACIAPIPQFLEMFLKKNNIASSMSSWGLIIFSVLLLITLLSLQLRAFFKTLEVSKTVNKTWTRITWWSLLLTAILYILLGVNNGLNANPYREFRFNYLNLLSMVVAFFALLCSFRNDVGGHKFIKTFSFGMFILIFIDGCGGILLALMSLWV